MLKKGKVTELGVLPGDKTIETCLLAQPVPKEPIVVVKYKNSNEVGIWRIKKDQQEGYKIDESCLISSGSPYSKLTNIIGLHSACLSEEYGMLLLVD